MGTAYSSYGLLFGYTIHTIFWECDGTNQNPPDKARGQTFVANGGSNGKMGFNLILKDVSPGIVCNRLMYEPCVGSIGTNPAVTCPGGK